MPENFEENKREEVNLDEATDEQLRQLTSKDIKDISNITDDQLLRYSERFTPGSTGVLKNPKEELDPDNPFLQEYVRRSRLKSELRAIEKPIPPGSQHDEERWERGKEALNQVKMRGKGKGRK